jgi:PilZ domain
MHERRKAPRVKVNLSAYWEGAAMRHEGAVTSLSKSGCFILTGGKVEPKELVRIEIDISNVFPLVLWGEVVEAAYEIGFAVRFNPIQDEEHKRLNDFMDQELIKATNR